LTVEVTCVDLFAGVGGIRLGFERAGAKCVWSNEINEVSSAVYRHRFGEENHVTGDIRLVKSETVPNHDILCAGFPCQPFSNAGLKRGFEETRGTLFFEIARVARDRRPRYIFLENVKGLLSHKKGKTLSTIFDTLQELGYCLEYQVLNSRSFGVPQTRSRVFIIGYYGREPTRTVFPIRDAEGMVRRSSKKKRKQSTHAIDANYGKGPDKHGQRTVIIDVFNGDQNEGEYAYALKTNQISRRATSSILGVDLGNRSAKGDRLTDGYSHSLTKIPSKALAVSFTNPRNKDEDRLMNLGDSIRTLNTFRGNQQPFIVEAPHGKFNGAVKDTINVRQKTQHQEILGGRAWRIMTPLECERAQAFPDLWTSEGIFEKGKLIWTGEYTKDKNGRDRPVMKKAPEKGVYHICDTQRYRMMGEAVTVNVIDYIARRLIANIREGLA